jgi:hypothetical protein
VNPRDVFGVSQVSIGHVLPMLCDAVHTGLGSLRNSPLVFGGVFCIRGVLPVRGSRGVPSEGCLSLMHVLCKCCASVVSIMLCNDLRPVVKCITFRMLSAAVKNRKVVCDSDERRR